MLRKLSPIERFTCLLGADEPVCFAMTARFRGLITLERLEDALGKAGRRHPLAAARVVEGPGGEPWFESTAGAPPRLDVIEPTATDAWTGLVEAQLTRLLDPGRDALVRYFWLPGADSGDLVVVCHHAVADGLSAAYLLRDIHRYLGDPDAALEPLPLMPPVEDLTPPELEPEQPMKLADLAGLFGADLPGELDANTTPEHPVYRLRAFAFDPERTTRLATLAPANHTSVHGVIGAAFLLAFAERYGDATGFERTLQSPVNLRPFLAQPVGESFGFFVNQVDTTVDCPPGRGLWDVARDLRASLRAQATPWDLLRPMVHLKQLVRLGLGIETLYRMGKGRTLGGEHDLTISNIGRLGFPARVGAVELVSLHGPTFSAMRNGKLLGVCTANDSLTMTFIHEESGLPPEEADALLESAMRHLDAALT